MSPIKTNTKAFVIAAAVILLCLASITGATLALFTTSTEDGKIGINATSGNLKVDIVDDTDKQNSLVGEVLKFVPKDGREEVFFEPGATYYTEGFRVKNEGSIPINYIIYISEDERLAADFSDAFEVEITKNPTDRDGTVTLPKFDGQLGVGQTSDVYYLVIRMKKTAGNEFQNRSFTGIGITVCAVQGNANIE